MESDFLKIRFAGVVGKLPSENNTNKNDVAYQLDQSLWQTAHYLQKNNIRVIGALVKQKNGNNDTADLENIPSKEAEEMNIQIFPTGEILNIFLPEKCAKIGCRLDKKPFEIVVNTVYALLERTPENDNAVILLNRFGKEEAEGHGYNKVLELAMEKNIPVIVGVNNKPARKGGHHLRKAWETYIEGTTGVSLECRLEEIVNWCQSNHILNCPHP